MIRKTYRITSENGLHARPATVLVSTAVKFKSDTFIIHNGKRVDMKSIMGVMSLGIYCGDTITFEITGEDEAECMKKINEMMFTLKMGKEI